MRFPVSLVRALVLLAMLGAAAGATASRESPAQSATSTPSLADGLRALDGVWVFFEDRTEGRSLEELGPPMSSTFAFRVEEGAVVLAYGHGGKRRDVRVALDGSMTEVKDEATGQVARYRGEWKDGALVYEIDFIRTPGAEPEGLIRREFRMTPDGLLVRFSSSVGLYRHAEDIPMPTPAKATIADIAWLEGAWVGTRGTGGSISMEERWTPPLGGSMLAVSRTVNRDRLAAFEYLRILEKNGGLVYIAQPNGAPGTEFVLTEISPTRAEFANPRHDYPKRIVYELAPDGSLSATIGQMKGGTPKRFEFQREAP